MTPTKILLAVLAVLVLVALMVGGTAYGSFKNLNALEGNCDLKWANYESALKERADLMTNMVQMTVDYRDGESKTMTDIANARAKMLGAQTPATKAEAAGDLNSALARLMVNIEKYPELKASDIYKSTLKKWEGTENRLRTARDDYSAAVNAYNVTLRNTIFFSFGHLPRPIFKAEEGEKIAPNFNNAIGKPNPAANPAGTTPAPVKQ